MDSTRILNEVDLKQTAESGKKARSPGHQSHELEDRGTYGQAQVCSGDDQGSSVDRTTVDDSWPVLASTVSAASGQSATSRCLSALPAREMRVGPRRPGKKSSARQTPIRPLSGDSANNSCN